MLMCRMHLECFASAPGLGVVPKLLSEICWLHIQWLTYVPTHTKIDMKDPFDGRWYQTSVLTFVQIWTNIDGFFFFWIEESLRNDAEKPWLYAELPDYVVLLAVYN